VSVVDEPMLLAGTLDLLVLRTLTWGPRHGYAIARWINETSRDAIQVEDRALYLRDDLARNASLSHRGEHERNGMTPFLVQSLSQGRPGDLRSERVLPRRSTS